LEHWWRIHHHRPILAEVNIAHRVEDVGVGGRHQGFGVEAFLPNGQDVVTGAKRLLRPDLHAERIDQRQRPEIRLRRSPEEQLIA